MCFWMQEVSLKSDLYVSCLHAWQNMKNYLDKLFWMLHRPLITHFIKLQHCNIIIAIRDKLSIILSTFPWQSLTNMLTFDPFCLMRLCSPGISWKIITLHYIMIGVSNKKKKSYKHWVTMLYNSQGCVQISEVRVMFELGIRTLSRS